ncbi:MAG: bifunctional metallophosphatase/5'-nucleotidase [Xenococcus sp. (in: cyanobacteria)]
MVLTLTITFFLGTVPPPVMAQSLTIPNSNLSAFAGLDALSIWLREKLEGINEKGVKKQEVTLTQSDLDSEPFTLQLLHASDIESGLQALEDFPRFSAVLNALKDDYPNTLILSSGDNYIPSPFLFAGSDPSLNNTPVGKAGIGHADIEILNQLGIQASTLGNHDFDLGTTEVRNIIKPSGDYRGTLFPYLSSNLDFSTEPNLSDRVTANGQEASSIPPGSLAGTAIITVNNEPIGIVGATTPLLSAISGSDDITVFPVNATDYDALAAKIQAAVDELTATGINKVILLAHMQQLNIERDELAPRLRDVDIIVAGGSHTLLSDATDHLRTGDTSEGTYPIIKTNGNGDPIAIVNTDANSKYVGRLVVDFDANGLLIPKSIDPKISGAYATDDQGVAAVEGTPDPEIVQITQALDKVIATQDGNLFGNTKVFLQGERSFLRTEETNLGNLTADANLAYAKTVDPTTVISIKNGGGIRSNIGVISAANGGIDPDDFVLLPPEANPAVGKEEGEVSQLDITNSLRFNNGLTLLTITADQLLQTIEHGVAATATGATPGQFPQLGRLKFSFDATRQANDRVLSLVVVDDQDQVIDVVAQNGELVGDPSRIFRTVTLTYLADGGDGYPFPSFLTANPTLVNRVDFLGEPDLDQDGVLDPVEDLNQNGIRDLAFAEPFEGIANFAPFGSEQDALAEYFHQVFPTADHAFNQADTEPALDERIQNLEFRQDTVIPR